jgi:hypothetical protein
VNSSFCSIRMLPLAACPALLAQQRALRIHRRVGGNSGWVVGERKSSTPRGAGGSPSLLPVTRMRFAVAFHGQLAIELQCQRARFIGAQTLRPDAAVALIHLLLRMMVAIAVADLEHRIAGLRRQQRGASV